MPPSRRTVSVLAVSIVGAALVAGGCGGSSSGDGPVTGQIHQPPAGSGTTGTTGARAAGATGTTGGTGVRGNPSATGFGSNWTVYHEDGLGNGVDPSGTNLRPLSHAWTSPALDGHLYGEPLVFGGRVIVGTENDTVYELAANSGKVIWSRHLATAMPIGPLPCGNIGPAVGITGTPVIDPARDEVFVVADQLTGTSGASHHLYGLNLLTGATELNQIVDPPGTQPTAQLQRSGLALDAGQVLVSFGGNYGDCGFYHGWEVAVPETGGKMRTFEVDHVGKDTQGAIWMGGAAPVVDKQGNVWVTVGNGSASSPPYDYSDSVLELSSTLALKQYFAPTSWGSDNVNDLDLGSDQVALLGGQAFVAGKSDNGYLLNAANLGGIGHEEKSMSVCGGDPDGGIASSGSTVYVPCASGLEAVKISQSPPSMNVLWQTSSGSSGPAVVASGLVWTIAQGGELYGLSPSTGDTVISVSIGSAANHFPTPTVADGLLLAPATNHVYAFKGPGGLPSPPSSRSTSATTAAQAGGRAVTPSNWTVYHQNSLGTGVDPSGAKLLPLTPAWNSPVLDGELYGEPLVYTGKVFVATESDTVYALAANRGKVLWSHHLAAPVPDSDLPCGDIHPTVGITGTPLIDAARNEIFVVADELTGTKGASHHIFGLNLTTGATELDQVVDPPGAMPLTQLQRPGLAIAGGRVLVAFGGNAGDCGAYHGWLVSVPEAGGALRDFEVDRPTGDTQGAIWMGGAAPVVDAQGDIWVVTGNGSVHASSPPWSNYDDSDAVLELSPTLSLLQFFAPTTWPADNAGDQDLGSDQVALVGTQAFIGGKSSTAYLLNRAKLGSFGHQEQQMPICGNAPSGGIAQSGSTVYVPCGHGLEAVQITASPPHMKLLWQTAAGSNCPAVIASGLIWSLGRNGVLNGLSPTTGKAVVSKTIGPLANHFPTPTVADGLLLVPAANRVVAFEGPGGLPAPPPRSSANNLVAARPSPVTFRPHSRRRPPSR